MPLPQNLLQHISSDRSNMAVDTNANGWFSAEFLCGRHPSSFNIRVAAPALATTHDNETTEEEEDPLKIVARKLEDAEKNDLSLALTPQVDILFLSEFFLDF